MGLLFFGIGVVLLHRERAFARAALAAPGIVVGFEQRRAVRRRNGRRRITYRDHPVVRYTTQAGQPTQFTSPIGTSPRLHREGQQLTVLYNPANPADARIAGGCMQYGLPIIFMIVGLALTGFAALFGLLARLTLAG